MRGMNLRMGKQCQSTLNFEKRREKPNLVVRGTKMEERTPISAMRKPKGERETWGREGGDKPGKGRHKNLSVRGRREEEGVGVK